MKSLSFILSLFLPLFMMAQVNHADCSNAIKLNEYTYTSGPLIGSGEKVEISGKELGNLKYFTEEHSTVWLSFETNEEGDLSFKILPKNKTDDYDFMLYRNTSNICNGLNTQEPVRSNMARVDELNNGVTGLSVDAAEPYFAAGKNSNLSSYLEVKKGESFLLVIDATSEENKGFTLSIQIDKEEISIEETQEDIGGFDFVDMTDDAGNDKIEITFKVLMEETKAEVPCHAEIIGVQWEDTSLVYDGMSSFTALIPKEKWFYVNVKKDGYTFGTEKYKASDELALSDQFIYISEVKKGNHIVLKEIVFRENTTHMLPSSINALEQLISFMNEYPTAEIEIQGHVNAPGYDNDGKVKRFSLKRAEQIKEYLVDAGIEGKRIKVAGMGNEYMIYPNPKTYDEEKVNRRVEIEILSF